jgi:Large polyvalent protein associated domain 38
MQGTWTSVRFLTQVVPFMNARIQGLYKLGKAAKEDPRKFSIVLGTVALASIALMTAYHDDDDWKKREDWDRDNYWWFKLGGLAYRIPKPFEIGAIGTLAERGVELFTDKEMTPARFLSRVKSVISDNLSMNPIPQAVKPILDIYSNKDSFTGRAIESAGMEKLAAEYRFNAGTSMPARAASTAINTVLSPLRPAGIEGPSPLQIDHLIRGYMGWLGSLVIGSADMALRPLTGEPSRPTADLYKFASMGFASETEGAQSRYVSQLYDQAKQLDEAYSTWREMLKEGKVDEARDYFGAHRAAIVASRRVDQVKAAEGKFNERIRMIERSNLSPDEKKAQIARVNEQKDRLARTLQPQ